MGSRFSSHSVVRNIAKSSTQNASSGKNRDVSEDSCEDLTGSSHEDTVLRVHTMPPPAPPPTATYDGKGHCINTVLLLEAKI